MDKTLGVKVTDALHYVNCYLQTNKPLEPRSKSTVQIPWQPIHDQKNSWWTASAICMIHHRTTQLHNMFMFRNCPAVQNTNYSIKSKLKHSRFHKWINHKCPPISVAKQSTINTIKFSFEDLISSRAKSIIANNEFKKMQNLNTKIHRLQNFASTSNVFCTFLNKLDKNNYS